MEHIDLRNIRTDKQLLHFLRGLDNACEDDNLQVSKVGIKEHSHVQLSPKNYLYKGFYIKQVDGIFYTRGASSHTMQGMKRQFIE